MSKVLLHLLGVMLVIASISVAIWSHRTWVSIVARMFYTFLATWMALAGLILVGSGILTSYFAVLFAAFGVLIGLGRGMQYLILVRQRKWFQEEARRALTRSNEAEAKAWDKAALNTQKIIGRITNLRDMARSRHGSTDDA